MLVLKGVAFGDIVVEMHPVILRIELSSQGGHTTGSPIIMIIITVLRKVSPNYAGVVSQTKGGSPGRSAEDVAQCPFAS